MIKPVEIYLNTPVGCPTRIPPPLPEAEEEKRRFAEGRQRREERLARRTPRG